MDRVVEVKFCVLRVVDGAWLFGSENAHRIDEHWQRRSGENPTMFNGVIHLMAQVSIENDTLSAEFIRTAEQESRLSRS